MSSKYTRNYKLCQWEPTDKVLREDFNGDNAKLETALTAHQAAIEKVQTKADAAYSPDYQPVVVGGYTGDGNVSKGITLGFQPKAVVVFPQDMLFYSNSGYAIYRGGMIVDGQYIMSCCPISITSNGFMVHHDSGGSSRRDTNFLNTNYFYLAVR